MATIQLNVASASKSNLFVNMVLAQADFSDVGCLDCKRTFQLITPSKLDHMVSNRWP